MKIKTIIGKIATLAIFIFLIIAGFGFLKVERASAAECVCQSRQGGTEFKNVGNTNVETANACLIYCNKTNVVKTNAYTFNGVFYVGTQVKYGTKVENGKLKSTPPPKPPEGVCNAGTWLSHPVNCALMAILGFVGSLLSVAVTLFVWIMDPQNIKNVIDNKIVYGIWTLIRDTLNVGFILVLLFSAFATVFQVESYNYKKLLFKIILMALLVNFSFPITRVIIDFSNVLMYYFLNLPDFGFQTGGSIFSRIANDSMLQDIINPPGGASSNTTFLLSAIIFLFIFSTTLLIIALLFIIRTIALALLIIFSPIAFVGSIIPIFSKESSQWWSMLFKYSFFGPVMIFMLYVAVRMMGSINSIGKGSIETIANAQSADPGIIAAMSFFAIPIIILWMGIGIAQSMSIAGAGAITGQGKKFMGWAGRTLTGYRAARWSTKKLVGKEGKVEQMMAKNKVLRWFSPTAFQKAWEERSEEKKREAFKPATGGWRDKINRVMSLGYEETRHGEAAIQNNIAEKQKGYESTSKEFGYLYDQYKKAQKAGKTEDMAALLRIINEVNEGNSFMKAEDQEFDPFTTPDRYYEQLVEKGMSKHMAGKQIADMGEVSVGKGMNQLFGAFKLNTATGKYEKVTNKKERAESIAGKINEIRAQAWADTFHWTSLFNQKTDGSIGKLHEIGENSLRNITGPQMQQMGRIRGDGEQRLIQGKDKIEAFQNQVITEWASETDPIKKQSLKMQNDKLDVFIDNIKKMEEGKPIK